MNEQQEDDYAVADSVMMTLEQLNGEEGHHAEVEMSTVDEEGNTRMKKSISTVSFREHEEDMIRRVQKKIVQHRLQFLWFGLKVIVLTIPVIFFWWLSSEMYYRDLSGYGITPKMADGNNLSLTPGPVGIFETGIGQLIFSWLSNGLQCLLVCVGIGLTFEIPMKQLIGENVGGWILCIAASGTFQIVRYIVSFFLGTQEGIQTPLMVFQYFGIWIAPLIGGRIVIKYVDLKWIPGFLIKLFHGQMIAAYTYIAFSAILFFNAKDDTEKAMIRLFLHGPVVEFAFSASRILAAKLTMEGGKQAGLVCLGLQFGMSVYSRMLVNNLETIESQILLSLAVSVFETTTRINARDVDYYGQKAWVNLFGLCRCSEDKERKDERMEMARHFRVNNSNTPDPYDYYRLFGEVNELIAIVFAGIASIWLRFSPGDKPLTWDAKLLSMITQLVIEWGVEVVVSFVVITMGARFHQIIAEKRLHEEAQESQKNDGATPRKMVVAWKEEGKRKEDQGGFKMWMYRRMAKSFRTHTRMLEAWENPPPKFLQYVVLGAYCWCATLYITFIHLAFCHGADELGKFMIPCARILAGG